MDGNELKIADLSPEELKALKEVEARLNNGKDKKIYLIAYAGK